jgi:glycosyltransferase involved in cell wall biosynthesis
MIATHEAVGDKRVPRRNVPTIVYFGNDWSGENRTSSHHIALQLSKTHRVIYIECPGLRAPSGSKRDVRKLFSKLAKGIAPPKRVSPSLDVYTLIQIPLHRFRSVRRFNQWITKLVVRRILRRQHVKDFITWFTVPHVASLAKNLGEQAVIYYCIDDYAALPGVNAQVVKDMDERLTRRADLVFVASQTLLKSKADLNGRTYLSPHGVDVNHFHAAQEAGEIPADVSTLAHPIVGFFGLIEAWIDLDLVEYLAQRRPNWTFVMIGRVAVLHSGTNACPNVLLLGARPYVALPAYGRAFDAAIIPYHLTQQVLHANPLKLREYLAMGKPIVAVRTPEIDQFADVVRVADTREEFLAHLDFVLTNPDSPAEIERRLGRVAESSWETRIRTVLARVEELHTSDRPAMSATPNGSPPYKSNMHV